MFFAVASTIVAFSMATVMIFLRLRSAQKPTTAKKIILPPLFMSTGALMFLVPELQISWLQVLESFSVGVFFSFFLIKTSRFETKDNKIFLIPSKAFGFILISLLLIRIGLKIIISSKISLAETSGMFFLLAFGMILSWRVAMLIKFKRIQETNKQKDKKILESE